MEIDLIKVNKKKIYHIRILFILLAKRKYKISHKECPSYLEHKEFVINYPYRSWYLIKKTNQFVGSAYITYENFIGINSNKMELDDYENTLKSLLILHDPLEPIKSLRNTSFSINVPPRNEILLECMRKMGAEHIQSSFVIKQKNN